MPAPTSPIPRPTDACTPLEAATRGDSARRTGLGSPAAARSRGRAGARRRACAGARPAVVEHARAAAGAGPGRRGERRPSVPVTRRTYRSTPPTCVGVKWKGDPNAQFTVEAREANGDWTTVKNVGAADTGADAGSPDAHKVATRGQDATDPVAVDGASEVRVTVQSGNVSDVSVSAVNSNPVSAPSGSAGALGSVLPRVDGPARYAYAIVLLAVALVLAADRGRLVAPPAQPATRSQRRPRGPRRRRARRLPPAEAPASGAAGIPDGSTMPAADHHPRAVGCDPVRRGELRHAELRIAAQVRGRAPHGLAQHRQRRRRRGTGAEHPGCTTWARSATATSRTTS